jgi:hypothetical protein
LSDKILAYSSEDIRQQYGRGKNVKREKFNI